MAQASPSEVQVKSIHQVSLVVRDLDRAMEDYWNKLGIGPWDVHYMRPPKAWGLTYYGKKADFTMKVAFTMLGAVELELIEPTSGNNIYSDFLSERSEGIHHLLFLANNVDRVTDLMGKSGFALTQSGHFNDGHWAYYKTSESLKAIWEVARPPEKASPDYRYPQLHE